MNLDELVQSIPDEDANFRENLNNWIGEWKNSEDDVNTLTYLIGKWHGTVWFKDQKAQNKFYEDWTNFKQNAIDGIGGMTMNERLHWFGLFERFDSCSDEAEKIIIYRKLLARP